MHELWRSFIRTSLYSNTVAGNWESTAIHLVIVYLTSRKFHSLVVGMPVETVPHIMRYSSEHDCLVNRQAAKQWNSKKLLGWNYKYIYIYIYIYIKAYTNKCAHVVIRIHIRAHASARVWMKTLDNPGTPRTASVYVTRWIQWVLHGIRAKSRPWIAIQRVSIYMYICMHTHSQSMC